MQQEKLEEYDKHPAARDKWGHETQLHLKSLYIASPKLFNYREKDWEITPELHFLNKEPLKKKKVSELIFPSQFKGKCLH